MSGNIKYRAYFNNLELDPGGFIAKFRSDDGSLVWVKRVLEITGYSNQIRYFNNNLYLGGISVDNPLVINGIFFQCNKWDPFIAKLDTIGTIIWVKTMGGKQKDMGGTIGMDVSGNIYTTGTFQDTAFFDNLRLIHTPKSDWYIAKYDNNGIALWAQQGHITGNIAYYGVNSPSSDGKVYCIGTFSGSALFGEFSITANSPNEMFLARYRSDGHCLGVTNVPNTIHGGVITEKNGNAYVTGSFLGTVNFGNIRLTSYGSDDIYIAKHSAITGVHEPQEKPQNQLTIYANPTTGRCTITIPEEFMHEQQLTLQVFNLIGKLVEKMMVTLVEGKIRLNLEAQAKGIYQVSLGNGERVYVGKVVFE
ncbi:MAG: T9SS type A sorting domain-containing protein [Bacteroidetes bacterium]|nr:T9SS type A sorting domain-containing protein [Bacteroidota bacterium]